VKQISALIIVVAVAILIGLWLGRAGDAAAQAPKNASFTAANSADPSPVQSALQEQIVSHEREELDSLKTGDMALFASLLADDAVFVDAHGAAGKAEVVKNTTQFRLSEYTMENVKFVAISTSSGLISYEITEKGASHGREFSAHVFVSALWAERAGKWICLFSQETPTR